jgi:hypothetical protein
VRHPSQDACRCPDERQTRPKVLGFVNCARSYAHACLAAFVLQICAAQLKGYPVVVLTQADHGTLSVRNSCTLQAASEACSCIVNMDTGYPVVMCFQITNNGSLLAHRLARARG